MAALCIWLSILAKVSLLTKHAEWNDCILYLIKRPAPGSWKASERGTDLGFLLLSSCLQNQAKSYMFFFFLYCKLLPPTYLSKAHDEDIQRC